MRIRILFIVPLIVLAVLVGCQDFLLTKRTTIVFVSDPNPIGYVNEKLSSLVEVQVKNARQGPVNNATVTFKISRGDATTSTGTVTTDANGTAFTEVTIGSKPGDVQLDASVADGPTVSLTIRVSGGHASKMSIQSGDGQEGVAGQALAEPLVVKVTDDFGTPAKDIVVKYAVREGNGILWSPTVVTDENGLATSLFAVGTSASPNKVAVVAGSDSVSFTEHGTAQPVLKLTKIQTRGIQLDWNEAFVYGQKNTIISKTGSDGTFKEVAPLKESDFSYLDLDVAPGVTYTYKVSLISQNFRAESNPQSMDGGDFVFLDGLPAEIVIDEPRNRAYISIPSKNEIEVIDLATQTVTDKIVIGSLPQRMSLSHDNSTLYVALFGSGDVAFLNLETKAITKVSVEGVMGDPRVFDVIEGAPNRVFVSGNPDEYGISYLCLIKTDEGNTVEKFVNQIIRLHPELKVDYGNSLYVLEESFLYKFSTSGDYVSHGYGYNPSITFYTEKQNLAVNPDGRLYADGQEIKTDLTLGHVFDPGVPAVNLAGDLIAYYSLYGFIESYNPNTYQKLHSIPFRQDYVYDVQLSHDGKTFYLLTTNYSDYRFWLIGI